MKSILLVPPPACRDRLLAAGPCGARPPRVRELRGIGWTDGPTDTTRWPVLRCALVLAWSGAAVPEGCDRLARLLGRRLCSAWTLGRAGYLAERAALLGLGEVVTVEGEKP